MNSQRDIQRERLFYLEFLAVFTGRVGRKDLVERFGISEAAATKDLSLYAKLATDVLQYDIREKTYVLSKAKPYFDHDVSQSLYSLSGERAIAIDASHAKRLESWITPSISRNLDLNLVSTITRCMYKQLEMKVSYISLSSGKQSKTLTPLALVNDGLRWHIRCFDHTKNRYADFNLTRFIDVKDTDVSNKNILNADPEWNKEVTLSLKPHPELEHPETISMDYDLVNGVKEITLKSCLVGYFLRHWNIDYSANASGSPKAQQLFLDNREELISNGLDEWHLK